MTDGDLTEITRQINALKLSLSQTNPLRQQERYNRMFGDLVELEQKRRWLKLRQEPEGDPPSEDPGQS